ncbi:hypothetical protein GGQ57_001415 [Parabacteroides faecis]|uniref:Uncharacterized protein n=1 Tax=Parabacteroides faecis TaxID=1217282 RepID=A0ABR6KJA4_9BACT|nr:hypothetical protein [Parabacteroides faecis]
MFIYLIQNAGGRGYRPGTGRPNPLNHYMHLHMPAFYTGLISFLIYINKSTSSYQRFTIFL